MPSVSIDCRTARAGSDGYAPLRLRIEHRGNQRFVGLKIKVLASKWNASRQRVTRTHPDSSDINRHLAGVEQDAQGALSRLQASDELITATRLQEAVREAIFGGEGEQTYEGFIPFAEDELDAYAQQKKETTARHYRTGVRKLLDFLERETGRARGNIVLPWPSMTPQLIRDFRTYMYEVRGNAANTVGKTLTQIKTIWRAAMKEGHVEDYPFEHITIDSEPSQKEKLDFEEVQALESADLPPGTSQARALDYFLFALYGGGMRFSDVATLQRKHIAGGRIQYRMKKTSEAGSVPIVDKAQAILERYDGRPQGPEARVFPILDRYAEDDRWDLSGGDDLQRAIESRNAYINRRLKVVQEEAEIDTTLTFHLARHSAAWILYRELEDIYAVKRILGHSRVEVTEEYLRGFPDDSIDDDYRDVF